MSIYKREFYGFTGPINLSHLPDHIVSLFRDSYDLPGDFKFENVTPGEENICWSGQVPKSLHGFIDRLKQGAWTSEMIDAGILAAKEDICGITPQHYPHAGEMIQDAINIIPHLDKNAKILIGGSVSPWIESICLANQFTDITTSDYEVRKVDDKRISFVHAHDIRDMKFDLIISFSSIEHDGLGRYGDPINPYGAFNAVDELYNSLNDNGYLLCGIPTLPEDEKYHSTRIEKFWHIIFSKKSVKKLFRKFNVLDIVDQTNYNKLWQHQPIYILQNNSTTGILKK